MIGVVVATIDFDEIEGWGPIFEHLLLEIAPSNLLSELAKLQPKFFEEAGSLVVDRVGRPRLIEHLNLRLAEHRVRVYHATRLSQTDHDSIRANGLLPLRLAERRPELERILSGHARWEVVKGDLDDVLAKIGPGERAGRREDGRIHVCFSRAGLMRGCSHYLTHGAEVDGHIANLLFGDRSAEPLLSAARQPYLVTFSRSYPEVAQAANPYGVPHDGLPGVVDLLLTAWAYAKAKPGFQPGDLKDCTAAFFRGAVRVDEIEALIEVSDADLEWGR